MIRFGSTFRTSHGTSGGSAPKAAIHSKGVLIITICGIGFRTADQIAAKLGTEKTALIRVRAGISSALAEAMDDGHCGLPDEELLALTVQLLEVTAVERQPTGTPRRSAIRI